MSWTGGGDIYEGALFKKEMILSVVVVSLPAPSLEPNDALFQVIVSTVKIIF